MPVWTRLIFVTASLCPAGERIILQDGFAFVNATINGHGPFRMLLDTGAAACMLTPDAARRAELKYDHRAILATLSGEKIIPAASINRVAIGTSERPGVEIDVLELPQIRNLDTVADGVIGQSFFGSSAYLIDYKRKKLSLGVEAVALADGLPIAITAAQTHGRTVLPVTLEPGAEPWRLTLDSGASNLVVECNKRCPPAGAIRSDSQLLTYVGDKPVSRGKLRHVEIGGVTMPSVEAVLVDAPAPDGADDGVLPARWFSAIYVSGAVVRLAR